MYEERYHLAVIDPTANQRLAAEYEGILRCFLDIKKDNKIFDEYFEASKSEFVAGTHAEIKARTELQQKLSMNNFESYKKARLAEIQQLLQEAALTQKRRDDLAYEARLLQVSSDYNSFGRNMRNFGDFEFEVYIPDDINEDHPDNRRHLEAVIEGVHGALNGRYVMMQSLAYAATNGDKLPAFDANIEEFYDKVVEGCANYNRDKKTKTIIDSVWDREYDLYNKQLAREQVGVHISRAIGMTQTYQDAVQALASSPIFKDMCRYYSAQAAKNGDLMGKVRWREAEYEQILAYAREKGLIPTIDNKTREQRMAKLYGPATLTDMMPKAMEEFGKLETAQNDYNFMVQMVEEFNRARQQDSQLIEKLDTQIQPDGLVNLNLDSSNMQSTMNRRLMGVSNLLIQENTVSEVIWEAGKETIIGAVFLGTGGWASVVGWGLTGLNVAGYMWQPSMDWQHATQQKLFNDTGLNRYLADIKNKPLVEQITKTVKDELAIIADRKGKIEKLGLNNNFDEMIEYGYNHSSHTDQEIFKMIKEARELAKLPQEDLEKMEKANAEALKAFDKKMMENPNNMELTFDQKDLFRQTALLKMARTGNYFYYAHLTRNILGEYVNDEKNQQIKKYSGEGLRILQQFNAVLEERVASEVELENRQLLAREWQNAGRPSMQEMTANSIYKHNDDPYGEAIDSISEILAQLDQSSGNITLRENSQQIDTLAYNDTQLTNFNNIQNA